MSWEQISNFGVTTLSLAAAAVDTTIYVSSAANLPSKGNFRLVIDSEIVLVTAVGGTTLTVTRAQEGTVAVAHSSGAPVLHVNTRGALDQTLQRIFTPTLPVVPLVPDPSVFTAQYVQAGGTLDNANDALTIFSPAAIAGGTWYDKAFAYSPPYTVTWDLSLSLPPGGGAHWGGVYLADSSHNAEVAFWQYSSGNLIMNIYKATGINTSTPGFPTGLFTAFAQWQSAATGLFRVRVVDDNTNLKWYLQLDGIHWTQIYTEARTATITPARVGFVAFSGGGGWDTYANVLRWIETTP
jgi:hypothetical protein